MRHCAHLDDVGRSVSDAGFTHDVVAVLRALPSGHVVTYGEVAAEAGHPGAARAVGTVLRGVGGVPWWRVVASTGRVNPNAVGEATSRLRAEGVEVRDGRVVRPRAPTPTPRARAVDVG